MFWRRSDATDIGTFVDGDVRSQENQDFGNISIERVSVGGHAGLMASQGWVRNTTLPLVGPTQVQNQHQTTVATLQSGLKVRFYF